MTSRSIREQLTVQLWDTERLLELVGDHPVMSKSLQQKAEELRAKLDQIPLDQKEAKIVLFFFGKPTMGSEGIDAMFAGKVLPPFQNMVKTDFAQRAHGKLGERGPARKQNEAKLFMTALPRGSFGIELTKLENENLYDETELADTLVHLTNLIEASAKSDDDFAVALEDAPARTITSLKDFLKVVTEDEAGVIIETGGTRCELNPEAARIAYDRVSYTRTDDDTQKIQGTLRGIMLNSWRFDFTITPNQEISGKISLDLKEEDVQSYFQYINQECVATFDVSKVTFKNGQERTRYMLLLIESL